MKIERNVLKEVRNSDIDKSGVFNIPEGVESIGVNAFYNCTSLSEINISKSVKFIGVSSFNRCTSLSEINIPDNVEAISPWTFSSCTSLKEIILPDSVKTIGTYSFNRCSSLVEINIPDSVKYIGDSAFDGCTSLEKINIPEGVETIEPSAFSGCTSLSEINLPNSVESIENYSFYGCTSLEKINIPEGVKTIEYSAFSRCYSLSKIIIPKSVKSIGNYAFYGCTSLEKIIYKNQILSVKDIDGNCMVIKSSKVLNDYQIYKAIYFDDYVRDKFKTVYCVKRGDLSSHGKTLKSAMQDITFKEMQSKDVSEHVARVKSQGFVTPNDYRLITGACRQGTERFLTANNLTWEDKMEISKVCELVKKQYGGSKFIEAMK